MQKDNSTFSLKKMLRQKLLKQAAAPVILETHGGNGRLFDACYQGIESGVVFEKDPQKVSRLAQQRPAWAVYEADCVQSIKAGAGAHLPVNFLDLDPYGECWPVLSAWFESDRPRTSPFYLVVNCGLRQKLRIGGAWNTGSMAEMVIKHGNDLHGKYLDICEELVKIKAAQVGYTLSRFGGYYCGHLKQMTHFFAILEQ